MLSIPAILGVESSSLTFAFDLIGVFAAVIYVALVYWTYTDARRRIADPAMVGAATAISLAPFVGSLVYLIVRPSETLQDAQERDLEVEAVKLRLHELESRLCPHCDYPIESAYLRCPSCLRKLKESCGNCSRPLERVWTICPYCEHEVPGAAPARRRRSTPSASQLRADESAGTAVRKSAARTAAGRKAASVAEAEPGSTGSGKGGSGAERAATPASRGSRRRPRDPEASSALDSPAPQPARGRNEQMSTQESDLGRPASARPDEKRTSERT